LLGQEPVDTTAEGFLKNGIYFENFGFTLPWLFNVADTPKYGNPRIVRLSKRLIDIVWDSVEVFNGIKVNFKTPGYKKRKRYVAGATLFGTIHPADFLKLKRVFDRYIPSNKISPDKDNFIVYVLRNVQIRLGIKSARYGNFLYIQKNM
jgi:hypothetical protein